jgi:ubiquinone biosynthesis protein COQ9
MPFYRSEIDENNMNLTILSFETHRNYLLNELKNIENTNQKEKQKIMNQLKTVERLISMIRDFNLKYLSNKNS